MITVCKMDSVFSLLCRLSCFVLFFFIHPSSTAFAHVSTDGTVGAALSLSGPDYQIPQDLGTTKGQNLFHSFHDFSIAQGESATFTGPDSIANVISRVTGGETSSIEGLLRSKVGQADFFFINPAGVVFGPNAQVDVPGAFHVTTADELRFMAGNVFSSSNSDSSTLSMAEPVSFGFLSPQSASIVLNGSQLTFAPESTITLAGGDITITGSETGEASMISQGGEIKISAVGTAPGQVPISDNAAFDMQGNIQLDSAYLTTSGNKGGKISIQAGDMTINSAIIAGDNTGPENSNGGIELLIDGDLTISHGSRVQTNVFEDGDSGKLRVAADTLLIQQEGEEAVTGLFAEVEPGAKGNAGGIVVNILENLQIKGVGAIISTTYGEGNAGDIEINAASLSIDGEGRVVPYRDAPEVLASICSETLSGTTGHGGTVSIDVENHFSIINNGTVLTSTHKNGNAGDLLIKTGTFTLNGCNSDWRTGVFSDVDIESIGNGGSIEVTVDGELDILNGAIISSSTFSEGNAGNVQISAGGFTLNGQNSYWPTGISSDVFQGSTGKGGDVEVEVNGIMEILNGAIISSETFSNGNAGNIILQAGALTIDSQDSLWFPTGISSDAKSGSTGDAGDIEVLVKGQLDILNGAMISNDTLSDGNAGNIILQAGALTIDHRYSFWPLTGISSNAKSELAGFSGNIQMTVDGLMEILNGAIISSSTLSEKKAGHILINAGAILVSGGIFDQYSGIMSNAVPGSKGDAGEVEVNVKEELALLNDGIISSGTNSNGDGGKVMVSAKDLIIDGMGRGKDLSTGIYTSSWFREGSENSTATSEVHGNAGSVEVIVTDKLQLINNGAIGSSTRSKGNGGKVMINAGELWIDGLNSEEFTGVSSRAFDEALGYVGEVVIQADLLNIQNHGRIDISSIQDVEEIASHNPDARIQVDAKLIHMDNNAFITAKSTGNVSAAAIDLNVSELVLENNSSITTAAKDANGGPITIQSNSIILRDALIITSVDGLSGDGGNIVLTGQGSNPNPGILLENLDNPADIIIFDGGFVQANAAPNAHGGDILINARAVIASDDELFVGDQERISFESGQGLNVIQAATEGGEQGTINITAPELDITGSLVKTAINFFQPARLATDPCSFAAGQGKSSLILDSQEGLQVNPEYPLDLFWGQGRLDMMLK